MQIRDDQARRFQTLETLALPSDAEPFERIVGVPTKPYVALTFTY
jgi:hypothetical protein